MYVPMSKKSFFNIFYISHYWLENKSISEEYKLHKSRGGEKNLELKMDTKKIINIFMKKCANCNFMPTNFSFLKNILKSLIIIIFHGLALGNNKIPLHHFPLISLPLIFQHMSCIILCTIV